MEFYRSIWRLEFQSWCLVVASVGLWPSLGALGTILSGLSLLRYLPARVHEHPDLESVWTCFIQSISALKTPVTMYSDYFSAGSHWSRRPIINQGNPQTSSHIKAKLMSI